MKRHLLGSLVFFSTGIGALYLADELIGRLALPFVFLAWSLGYFAWLSLPWMRGHS